MPDMTGLELLPKAKAARPDVPIGALRSEVDMLVKRAA
jgi:CheY-like chemotaxis protein